MKYFIIAGEASGDLHGSRLMEAIKKEDSEAVFMYQGGDLMSAEGGTQIRHYRETSYMLLEVVFHLGTILKNMRYIRKELLQFKPDVLILIDYPGFNLRMAQFAKQNGLKVFYYISPKVWAWKKGRVRRLRRDVDRLFVIFPFEVEYFRQRGIEVEYFGNPLVDEVEKIKIPGEKTLVESGDKLIALLAGSRKQEIYHCLPPMLKAAQNFPGYRFVLAGAPSLDRDDYLPYLEGSSVELVINQTYELLQKADAAIVTSGTATLETALFNVPQVVVYRMGRLSYLLGSLVLKIPYISLVNIILQKTAVKELIQTNLVKRISDELELISADNGYREEMLENYRDLRELLGSPGATGRTGKRMVELLMEAS